MAIEAARVAVEHTLLSPASEAELRRRARIRSSHFSTRIEGNLLSLAEAEKVIEDKKTLFAGRERDVREVRNYWNALIKVEQWAEQEKPLTEELIKRLHSIVLKGRASPLTAYRDGQNVIRDSVTGAMVYLPPTAGDVAALMSAMVKWAKGAEKDRVPAPIIAGLVHYQFVTIHPFYDGNGRTARLLSTLLLHRSGFGLNGFFSMEEHHARDLEGYYRSLAAHQHHNYYEGRARANLTPWLEYFIKTLAEVFDSVSEEAQKHSKGVSRLEPESLKRLDRRARAVLALFSEREKIKTSDIAGALGLSQRMARILVKQWISQGWLIATGTGNRNRAYVLSEIYRKYLGNLSAIKKGLEPSP
jgi:Fic family protein